jgi:hypothetical protein
MIVVFLCSTSALAGKNPADYPLKAHILQQQWESHNAYRGTYRATGRGNIWEGDSIHGFDFRYECSIGLRRTPRNQGYPARWKKPSLRLSLLAARIGEDNKYQECQLETTVRNGVYVLNPRGMTEVSQEDFKDLRARREAARVAQSLQNPGEAAATAKLSVSSIPADAEIEVDGEFVGNTPSVLVLETGDHTIVVRSAGYARWEKTMRLVPGEVKLSAELQPETVQGQGLKEP